MPDSPISATPYELLGVSPTATDDELRRAYRRLLRTTHPDTGGDAARFIAIQRAWERIGTPEDRAAYDRGRSGGRSTGSAQYRPREESSGASARTGARGEQARAPFGGPPRQDTRPRARAYGHPGGWRRERYLEHMREWVGRGTPLDDPYDPALVRSAPRGIRRILADALAEESTARTLSALGIGFTVWHDVATLTSEEKIDHIVLGPTGLFALLSEDYGEPVRARKGELVGTALADDRPMHSLANRAARFARPLKLKFTGLIIVLPDDALELAAVPLGSIRGSTAVAVRQSHLASVMRNGVPGAPPIGGNELFDIRTKLLAGIRFA